MSNERSTRHGYRVVILVILCATAGRLSETASEKERRAEGGQLAVLNGSAKSSFIDIPRYHTIVKLPPEKLGDGARARHALSPSCVCSSRAASNIHNEAFTLREYLMFCFPLERFVPVTPSKCKYYADILTGAPLYRVYTCSRPPVAGWRRAGFRAS